MYGPATAKPFRGVDLAGSSGPFLEDMSFEDFVSYRRRKRAEPLAFYCTYCDEKRDRATCPACGHHTHLMREIK